MLHGVVNWQSFPVVQTIEARLEVREAKFDKLQAQSETIDRE